MKKRTRLQESKKVFDLSPLERTFKRALFPDPSGMDSKAEIDRFLAKESYRSRYEGGDTEALFEFVAVLGEKALEEKWVKEAIRSKRAVLSPDWKPPVWIEVGGKRVTIDKERIKLYRDSARKDLYRIGQALANVSGSGVIGISGQKKRRVIQDCKLALSFCQKLKRDLKKIWKSGPFSRQAREKFRERLAQKYSREVEEIGRLESYFLEKATPFAAMIRLVASKHFLGEKTVEKIYGMRRKPTTPIGERTL